MPCNGSNGRLVMAAFWSTDDDDTILARVGDAVEDVSEPKSGGVTILTDRPDRELRRMLDSLPGLESAATWMPSDPLPGQERSA